MQVLYKRMTLAAPGKVLVEVGDYVQADDILAELDYIPGAMQRIEAARALGITPRELGEKMQVAVGDRVSQGDILAQSDMFYTSKEVLSPIDGHLSLFSRNLGSIYLRRLSLQVEGINKITYRAADKILSTMGDIVLTMSNADFIDDFMPARQYLERTGRPLSGDAQVTVMAGQRLFRSIELDAPFTCRISKVSLAEGIIELVPLFENRLRALLNGYICDLPAPGECIIAGMGHYFPGVVGFGLEARGRLVCLSVAKPLCEESDLAEHDLEGCIVVVQGSCTNGALHYLTASGAVGLVCGSLDHDTLKQFAQLEPLSNMGRLMTLPYPIILMQGYEGSVPADTFQRLQELDSTDAIMDANTQLRAGVVRPELMIPFQGDLSVYREELLAASTTKDPGSHLQVGDTVILMREPFTGSKGEVLSIGVTLDETPAKTRAVLASIRISELNDPVAVPLANCRKISQGGRA